MTYAKSYSFGNVVVAIDGINVTGFADANDVIMIAPIASVSTMQVGAGGDSVISESLNKGVEITLKLQSKSRAHQILEGLCKTSRLFSFSVTNNEDNEGGSSSDVYIKDRPSVSFGKESTDRQWVLHTGNWNVNYILG